MPLQTNSRSLRECLCQQNKFMPESLWEGGLTYIVAQRRVGASVQQERNQCVIFMRVRQVQSGHSILQARDKEGHISGVVRRKIKKECLCLFLQILKKIKIVHWQWPLRKAVCGL